MADRVRAAVHGFDAADTVAAYERARPSYPAEAVAHVVGHGHIGPGRRVLDLAAGTGKLTRLLVPTGASIVAVEPMDAMRRELAVTAPDVEVLDGTAESIPLPDDSVDVVTVGQAFHWFDPLVALAEIRRVLAEPVPKRSSGEEPSGARTPDGGWLFLLWNIRDRNRDWVRQFGELLLDGGLERPYDSYYDVDYAAVVAEAGGFTPVEVWDHSWEQPFDEELLVARSASVSVVGALDEERRAAVLARVRNLARTHPELAGRAWFGFPYVTAVWRCQAA